MIARVLDRLDVQTLAGIALAALAAALVMVLTRPPDTIPVLAAARDIEAGRPLAADDVTVRRVVDATGLVAGDALGGLEDWTLAVPLREGEVLVPSLLREPERTTMPDLLGLSLDAEHAVHGRLSAGDSVDVYVTWPAAPDEARLTERLARNVFVTDTQTDSGAIGNTQVDLIVAVDADLAALLTAALHGGDVDLVRVGP